MKLRSRKDTSMIRRRITFNEKANKTYFLPKLSTLIVKEYYSDEMKEIVRENIKNRRQIKLDLLLEMRQEKEQKVELMSK